MENYPLSLLDFFDDGKKPRYPNNVWLRERDFNQTQQDCFDKTCRLASLLIERGVSSGEVVAIYMPNSANMILSDFAVLRCGAVFVNLDVSLPPERLVNLLKVIKPRYILTDQLDEVPGELNCFPVISTDCSQQEVNWAELKRIRESLTDTDLCCLIATSGSTGTPKAVALNNRGLIDFICWFNSKFKLCQSDIVGSLSPLFFDGYIPGLFSSLCFGAVFDILPRELASFPPKLVQSLYERDISFIFWVPSTIVPIANFDLLSHFDLPKLKFVGFAGEVMPPHVVHYLSTKLPNAKLVNFYGPIEVSVICTYYECNEEINLYKPLPIGMPCLNTKILILDGDDIAQVGKEGEICVGGAGVASGYFNNDQKTNASFVQNPLVKSHRETIYRTGDLGYIDENGLIHFIGRLDFQIKHQGYRIDLAEIEFVLSEMFDGLSCCVWYNKNSRQISVAYEHEFEQEAAVFKKRLLQKLPKYMIPTLFVRYSKLPLNANGKIDRKKVELDNGTLS